MQKCSEFIKSDKYYKITRKFKLTGCKLTAILSDVSINCLYETQRSISSSGKEDEFFIAEIVI